MKIRDKNLKKLVDVSSEECPRLQCYWPRLDPGSFTQGVGYRYRSDDWICGTREINGCPDKRETKTGVGVTTSFDGDTITATLYRTRKFGWYFLTKEKSITEGCQCEELSPIAAIAWCVTHLDMEDVMHKFSRVLELA